MSWLTVGSYMDAWEWYLEFLGWHLCLFDMLLFVCGGRDGRDGREGPVGPPGTPGPKGENKHTDVGVTITTHQYHHHNQGCPIDF